MSKTEYHSLEYAEEYQTVEIFLAWLEENNIPKTATLSFRCKGSHETCEWGCCGAGDTVAELAWTEEQ